MSDEYVLFERARKQVFLNGEYTPGWPTGRTLHRLDCSSLPKGYEPDPDKVMSKSEAVEVANAALQSVAARVISPVKVCKRCCGAIRDALEMDLPPVACPACDGTGRVTGYRGMEAGCGACKGSGVWTVTG